MKAPFRLLSILQFSALAAIALIAVEVTTRFDDWARFDVPIASNTVSMEELIILDTLGMHARPNSQLRKFRINSLGFRGDEVPAAALDTEPFIVVSGASESFGLYESQNKEWPRQLEDSLSRQCGANVVVGNAAFAGMSLPTVKQDVLLRLAAFRPRVIVYYPTPMQFLEKALPVAAEPARHAIASNPKFKLRSVSRFRDAIKAIVPSAVLDFLRQMDMSSARRSGNFVVQNDVPVDRLQAYENGLRSLVGAIRSIGATPVLVIHQNRFFVRKGKDQERWLRAWERFYPRYTGDAILAFDRLGAERTVQVGADSSVVVVDPREAIAHETPTPFADFSHFNDRGAAIVGGAVANRIRHLICPSGP